MAFERQGQLVFRHRAIFGQALRRCPRCAGLRLLRTEEAEDAGLRQRRPPGKRRPPLWDCLMLAGIRRSPPRGRVQSCLQEFREVLRTLRQRMRAVPAPVPVLTLQEPCQPFPQRPVHVAGDRPPDPAAWQGGEAEHVWSSARPMPLRLPRPLKARPGG